MSLIAIKQHMQQVQVASLGSLCAVFAMDKETMRCQLSHWIRKGKLIQCMKTPACGSKCFKCQDVTTEIYQWFNDKDIQG